MLTIWTQDIKDTEEKEAFTNHIRNSKAVLDKIVGILIAEQNALDRSETDMKSFDQPNWEYRQAYKNGYRACLTKITSLVDIDK